MELPFDYDGISILTGYVRTSIQNDESIDKECTVCGLVHNGWSLYQYACGHYGHTRCVRKWTYTIQKVQCPWCREQTPVKMYCDMCNKWANHTGSDEKNCPVLREMRQLDELFHSFGHWSHYDKNDINCLPKRRSSRKKHGFY